MSRKQAGPSYSIPVDRLDDRNLLILILERVEGLAISMSELTQAVADLGAATAGVTARLADLLQQAQAQVAAQQERIDALQIDDDAQKAAVADGQQKVADLLTEASGAAAQIESSVADLNKIGAPADDAPADPAV